MHTSHHDAHDSLPAAADYWEESYASSPRRWSGAPNAFLVETLGDAHPVPDGGTALELGCGEGGDAIWLAGLGWQVTAVDVSQTALARAQESAADAGLTNIRFERIDLNERFPDGMFDLVTASYLHSLALLEREAILRRAWRSVLPGGRLVLVSHADAPPASAMAHGHVDLLGPGETIAALQLPADDSWSATARHLRREMTMPDGTTWLRTDHVVVVTRAGAPTP